MPDDPSIGFLPPNNGTSGQGFVTFRVQTKEQVTSLARIDANASIVFDQNEPILTPPIFNTVSYAKTYSMYSINKKNITGQIDSSKPSSNSTIVETLLQNGTFAIQVEKFDTGSGVSKVDVYQITGVPLLYNLH